MTHPETFTTRGVARPPLAALAALVALLAGGCGKDKPEPAAPPPPPLVEVADVVQRDVPVHQEWVGSLDGMVNAQILAQVTGYLVRQNYREGQRVRKGELLYEIDPRTFQATLEQAKANLARQEAVLTTARLEMKRVERLLPEKAVSVRDRDNAVGRVASAEAQVLAAKAMVETARLELGFTRILAPIDGIAGISKAQIGNLVGPGSANAELTTVSQVDPIKAYIPLSEQEYLRFARDRRNGADEASPVPLELILADGSVYPHPGKFLFADREVDVKTGTIRVATLFPNPGDLLRPGQYARIRAVVRNRPGALLVPARALMEMQGRQLAAIVADDGSVSVRPVQAAETVGSLVVIEQGLQPGQRVIVEGQQKVRGGMKVTPKPYAPAAPGATR